MSQGHIREREWKVGRPPKPDMTDEEAKAIDGMVQRQAAWRIGEMRGAKENRRMMVSPTWVRAQREGWEKRGDGRKWVGRHLITESAGLGGNSVVRDTGDPEYHQGTSTNPEVIVNATEGPTYDLPAKVQVGKPGGKA